MPLEEVIRYLEDYAACSAAPTTDAYGFGSPAVPHVAGGTFSPAGHITTETRFGDYSSVVPEYNSNGTCVEGTYALVPKGPGLGGELDMAAVERQLISRGEIV